jgi:hypothetical protein
MGPMSAIGQSIREIPRSSALERYERQEAVETELRLVNAIIPLRQAQNNVIAQRTNNNRSQRLPDERRQAHQTDLGC